MVNLQSLYILEQHAMNRWQDQLVPVWWEFGEGNELLMIQSIPSYGVGKLLPMQTCAFEFIVYVNADKSRIKMHYEQTPHYM